MRVLASALLLVLVAGCASSTEDTAGVNAAVTGGSKRIESSVVYLYATAEAPAPACVGALLSESFAVTSAACAKIGMLVGRATNGDGKDERVRVGRVILPQEVGTEPGVALVQLATKLEGSFAVVTHAPLRDGYSVNGVASVDGGFFAPDTNEASSIGGRMVSETDTHAFLVPSVGSQLCVGDIGAPVCSSVTRQVLGWDSSGACGLSGIVIGAPEGTAAAATPAAPGCSAGAWKVATLGRHETWLKTWVPNAFQPIGTDGFFSSAHVADGLWGWKSEGTVKTCQVETTALPDVVAGAPTKLSAKVSFEAMQENASPFGRFGIAPKSDPTRITWLPAKQRKVGRGPAFETMFDGEVSAQVDGEYLVGFRSSANGGEAWTTCDRTGMVAALDPAKALTLQVGPKAAAGTTPPATETAKTAAPALSTTDSELQDSRPEAEPAEESAAEENEMEAAFKPRKKAAEGCAASPGAATSGEIPLLGLALGLAIAARRRRSRR